MKTYKLVIKINNHDRIESIKETMTSDERCLEVDDVEITDHMDVDTISLLKDVNIIGLA
jgi:nicotinic acid mononucleotide adenylyltransferase